MRTITWCVCFSVILAGCSKQQESPHRQDVSERREIAGEIFTRNSKNEIVKQPGAMIYFLTASEHESLVSLFQEWRDKKYQSEHELWDKTYKQYKALLDNKEAATVSRTNSLVLEYRKQVPNDPRSDDELTLLFGKTNDADGRYNNYGDFVEDYVRLTGPGTLGEMAQTINKTKARIEEKIYDKQFPLNEEPIKQFLSSVHWTTADSEGEFKVLLSLGRECWVVAREEIPPERRWDFRFIPDGTSLVLSDGNAMQ